MSFLSDPKITLIKVIAIMYATIIYSFGGILLTAISDKYLVNRLYDKTPEDAKRKSHMRQIIETTIVLAVFSVLAYFGRNILQMIPFPFDGMNGFEYNRVKEVSSGALVLWILINYSSVLTSKIGTIRNIFLTI